MNDQMTALVPLVARVVDAPADGITAATRFDGLGRWGSLAAMRLLASVERAFGLRMDLRRYVGLETVGELAEEIAGLLPSGSAP